MKLLLIINAIALSQALTFGKTNFQTKQLVSELPVESEPISPYAFSYTADATDGSSSRQESSDGSGVVRGSYSIVSSDGIKRIVNYIADENGFRAQVQTNEPGTESKSSANVLMQSSQLPAEEIALKYGPRPFEQKQEVQTIGFQNLEQVNTFGQPLPKTILLNRPLIDQTLLKQRTLFDIPLQTKLDSTILPEPKLTQNIPSIPTFHTISKPIETPIKLLSRIPKIQTLKTNLDLHNRDELLLQNNDF